MPSSSSAARRPGASGWPSSSKRSQRIFNYDTLHIGGGNAKKLKGPFPDNVHLFEKIVDGLAGGVRLWQDEDIA